MNYLKPEWPVYRLIPSQLPTIAIFETIYDTEEELMIAFELEALTNDLLKAEAGQMGMVRKGDFMTGDGCSPIMAAFTHIGFPSRFTSGDFGVYYGADSVTTSIAETMHHKAIFLAATKEPDTEITMRCYINRVAKPLLDICAAEFAHLHDPNDYTVSQAYGKQQFDNAEYGLFYRSVRNDGARCIAALRPTALTPCIQNSHYRYVWSGYQQKFTSYFKICPED